MNKKIKKLLVLLVIGVLSFSVLTGCTEKDEKEELGEVEESNESEELNNKDDDSSEKIELTISAAASLTDVMEDIKELYEKENDNIELTFTFGSSGALQAQIEEGAPVDLFISAAEKQMDALEEGGHILDDSRKSLLVNNVVLIKPTDADINVNGFEDLVDNSISKIAIGDPGNVPVGQYSEEIFDNLEIRDQIEDKLVLAEDVRTVLSWVEMGEADLGIVYATDAFTTDAVEIISNAPEGSHKEVTYPVAVVKDSKHEDAAKDFIDFLSQDNISELFESYGFEIK